MYEEEMEAYIKAWHEMESPKPSNDTQFINNFITYIKAADADCWEFSGDNGYCGSTATITDVDQSYKFHRSLLDFEIAFSCGVVKVFTLYHDGFWTPEYINIDGAIADEISGIMMQKLIEWAGFQSTP